MWVRGRPQPAVEAQRSGSRREGRWRPHRGLAAAVKAISIVMPFAASMVVVAVVAEIVPHPVGPMWSASVSAWLLAIVAVGVVSGTVADRLGRPFLPLAALLQMSLVFPDRAPSRILVALRGGSARAARRLLEDDGTPEDERAAATRILVLVSALSRHDRVTRGHC